MIISISSVKNQMKESARNFNVSSSAAEEVEYIVTKTLESIAIRTVKLLKRKKTATPEILTEASMSVSSNKAGDRIAKAPLARAFRDMMDKYGEESNYRMTKEAEIWLATYVNDFVYTLSILASEEADEDKKRTLQPQHIKLAHRTILITNLWS